MKIMSFRDLYTFLETHYIEQFSYLFILSEAFGYIYAEDLHGNEVPTDFFDVLDQGNVYRRLYHVPEKEYDHVKFGSLLVYSVLAMTITDMMPYDLQYGEYLNYDNLKDGVVSSRMARVEEAIIRIKEDIEANKLPNIFEQVVESPIFDIDTG